MGGNADTVETRTKNHCVIKATHIMFCKESLRKIKFRAFPKQSLESVDYFGTSEHYLVVKKE